MSQRVHEPSNFYVWLLKQDKKNSPIGDVARYVKSDPLFPRAGSSIKLFKDYFLKNSVDSLLILALEDSWLEYSESSVSEITGQKKP